MKPCLSVCFIHLALAASLVLGLSGCASLGFGSARPLTAEGTRQALTIGASTKADVAKVLGDAKVTRFGSGYEVWVYNYKPGLPMFASFIPVVGTLSSIVDATTRDRELAILFDQGGVVRKYRMREAESRAERLLLPH